MADKKKHINNESDLFRAMRLTGYCFPTNEMEQKISFKLQPPIDILDLAKNINPSEIWEQEDPRPYKRAQASLEREDVSFEEQWGMAAKGSADISKEILDKIKKRQSDTDSNGGNPKT